MNDSTSTRRRRVRRALAALAVTGTLASGGVALAAAPASAATCATAGHAYLTRPGQLFFSGFEGDRSAGVPTLTIQQGTGGVRVGGNGILPGSGVVFRVFNRDSGAFAGFIDGRSDQYLTRPAASNCVVNEEGPFAVNLPVGRYRVDAIYGGGNSFSWKGTILDTVTNLDVTAPPPPPEPTYPDPDPWQNPWGPLLY